MTSGALHFLRKECKKLTCDVMLGTLSKIHIFGLNPSVPQPLWIISPQSPLQSAHTGTIHGARRQITVHCIMHD